MGCIDRQVWAGTFHIIPTLFHNPAVGTIWWPARGEERRGKERRGTFWLVCCHLYSSIIGVTCQNTNTCHDWAMFWNIFRFELPFTKFSDTGQSPVNGLGLVLSLHVNPTFSFVIVFRFWHYPSSYSRQTKSMCHLRNGPKKLTQEILWLTVNINLDSYPLHCKLYLYV